MGAELSLSHSCEVKMSDDRYRHLTDQGFHYRHNTDNKEDTVESLKEELREANQLIEKLKSALGPNHPLGRQRGFL
jgi:hypothetical protein